MSVCYVSADLCGFRASILEEDGSPDFGLALGTVYTLKVISLQVAPTQDAGDNTTFRDACGEIYYTRSVPATSTGATLTLTLARYELETIAGLTGAEVITGPGSLPGYSLGTDTPAATEVHIWTKAFQDGGATRVASPNEWYHVCYPHVVWTAGSKTFQSDPLNYVLTGTATTNGNIGTGGFGDIPAITNDPYEIAWLDDDIPDPDVSPYNGESDVCGMIDTPASA